MVATLVNDLSVIEAEVKEEGNRFSYLPLRSCDELSCGRQDIRE
jgi:hypothetical protein